MSTKYAAQSTATREPFNPITPPGSSTRGSAHRAMSHRPGRVESPDFLVATTSPEDPARRLRSVGECGLSAFRDGRVCGVTCIVERIERGPNGKGNYKWARDRALSASG